MRNLELGIIGNSSIGGLVDHRATLVWLCLPRLDGDPVYNSLLGGDGEFAVDLADYVRSRQLYRPNTAVLVTELEDSRGGRVEITDFVPRFSARGRTFRPMAHVRRLRPLSGRPRISLRLNPTSNWGERRMTRRRGINHIRFEAEDATFRVTTDAPLSYVIDETRFVLDRELSFVTSPDESLSEPADIIAREWEERTVSYWRNWVRRLSLPLEWQEAVIRAAITLKLCVYEETGGIVAALTSSIPEHEKSERNWDYRFCWLRDAYFTVTALNRLSAVGTLEHYLSYLNNIISQADGGHIQPVYGVGLESDLTERTIPWLGGYRGHGPVRVGNQAAEHIQHDVYGHVVLASAQSYFDTRLLSPPSISDFHALERVGERAVEMHSEPDAGIWEYRTRAQVHTSSSLMCWAACDRLSKTAHHLQLPDRSGYWRKHADAIHAKIVGEAWCEKIGAFTGAFGGETLDASVLLMAEVGFLPADDPRFLSTLDAMSRELKNGSFLFRYVNEDDFGAPKTAFTVCAFWYIDALARAGRRAEAREMFEEILSKRTTLGLLSEDIEVSNGELWGNFPQTYSMVGIINAAARLSRPWADVV